MTSLNSTTKRPRYQDHTGRRFGRWLVLAYAGKRVRRVIWHCRCNCGTEKLVQANHLTSKASRSCGCLRPGPLQHGHATRKTGTTSEYHSWAGIKGRCCNPNTSAYRNYGGRGITMCESWKASFECFLEDMGSKPGPEYSIHRIANNQGYSKKNCKWATAFEQQANTRRSRQITFMNETHIISEWVRTTGINRGTLCSRLDSGWSIERALTEPVRHYPIHHRSIPVDSSASEIGA